MFVVNIAGRLKSMFQQFFSRHRISFTNRGRHKLSHFHDWVYGRTCSSFQTSKSFIILLIKVGSRTRMATLLSFLKTEIWYDSLKIPLLLLILPIWPFHPVTSVHFTSVLCISFSSVVQFSILFCCFQKHLPSPVCCVCVFSFSLCYIMNSFFFDCMI